MSLRARSVETDEAGVACLVPGRAYRGNSGEEAAIMLVIASRRASSESSAVTAVRSNHNDGGVMIASGVVLCDRWSTTSREVRS